MKIYIFYGKLNEVSGGGPFSSGNSFFGHLTYTGRFPDEKNVFEVTIGGNNGIDRPFPRRIVEVSAQTTHRRDNCPCKQQHSPETAGCELIVVAQGSTSTLYCLGIYPEVSSDGAFGYLSFFSDGPQFRLHGNITHLSVYDSPEIEVPLAEITHVSTQKKYLIKKAETGARPYIDRSFVLSTLTPGLEGALLVCTANDDKNISVPEHLVLKINAGALVSVCYDKRGAARPPAWLVNGGWARSDASSVSTTDVPASPWVVFQKQVSPGMLTLGGNQQGGGTDAGSHYFVIVKASA